MGAGRRIGTAAHAPPAVCQSLIPSSSRCHKMLRQLVRRQVTLMIKPGRVHSARPEPRAFGWSPHKVFFPKLCEVVHLCPEFSSFPTNLTVCACLCESVRVRLWPRPPRGKKEGLISKRWVNTALLFITSAARQSTLARRRREPSRAQQNRPAFRDNSIKLNDRKHPVRHGCCRATRCKTDFQ